MICCVCGTETATDEFGVGIGNSETMLMWVCPECVVRHTDRLREDRLLRRLPWSKLRRQVAFNLTLRCQQCGIPPEYLGGDLNAVVRMLPGDER